MGVNYRGWGGLYFDTENWLTYGLCDDDFSFNILALTCRLGVTGWIICICDTYMMCRGCMGCWAWDMVAYDDTCGEIMDVITCMVYYVGVMGI